MKQVLGVLPLLAAAAAMAQVPPTSPIATETLVVRGRCVDAASGTPLARCRVQWTGHQSTGYATAWSRSDWIDPPEITTGVDGTFRVEVRLPAADEELDRGRYHLQITHARTAAWFSHCSFVVAMARGGVDYGDVRLPVGVRPRIRCEDEKGMPQPGVLLYLRPVAVEAVRPDPGFDGDGPQSWISSHAYGRTDIDGQLHLEGPLCPGEYALEVRGREASGLPKAVKLPCADAILAVVAPVDASRVISGRVVDAAGQPVAGASLSDGEDGPTACVSQRDGRFTLVAEKPPTRSHADLRMAQNRRFDGWQSLGAVAWGQRDVELVVSTKDLHTFVVRTRAGAPVEAFNLYCMRQGRASKDVLRLSGVFPGGRATCRLPAGDFDVLVVPRSDQLLANGWSTITVDPASETIEVSVRDAVARTVQVVFADDRTPVAGVWIEAVDGGVPEPFGFVRPATLVQELGMGLTPMKVVAAARSDGNGRATLQLDDPGTLSVRVSGPGMRAVVCELDLTAAAVAPVVVERGATLSGTIGPREALQALDPERATAAKPSIYSYHSMSAPTLTIVDGDGRVVREGVRIDHHGRFRCDGLPVGRLDVALHHRGNGGDRNEAAIPLGSHTLSLAAPLTVDLRLPAGATSGR